MKNIILLISFISLSLFGQEPEVDKIYIRENAYFDGVSWHPDTVDQHIRRNNDTLSFTQPVDSVSFSKNVVVKFHEYTIKADTVNHTFTVYLGESEISPQLFLEMYQIGYNNTGSTILNGSAIYTDSSALSGFGQFKLATATDKDIAESITGIATHDIENGTIGFATKYGNLTKPGHGYTVGSILHVSDTSYGDLVEYEPTAPNYNVRVGRVLSDSVIQIDVIPFNSNDTETNLNGILNGVITKKQALRDTIISNILYFETYNEDNPEKNLPFLSSNVRYLLNTTTNSGTRGYARVALNYGTSLIPATNYIYIDNSGTPALAVSTTAFPDDGIRVAECGIFDQTTHETKGFAYMQRFNNAVDGTAAGGWVSRAAQRIRLNGSVWESGVDPTFTITTSAGLDSLKLTTTSGIVWQFNRQTFQERNEKKYLWLNSPTGTQWITDLAQINVDANNVTLRGVNIRYGLNLFAIQNSGNYDDIIAVTTPLGSYSNNANAINDINNFAVKSVPAIFSKTAVRLCRIVVNYTTSSGGTFTNLLGAGEFQDERGQPLGTGGAGSGSGSAVTNFSDVNFTVFDNVDPTKILQFENSGISTGTTRTLTIPDSSGTVALKEYSFQGSLTEGRVAIGGSVANSIVGKDSLKWINGRLEIIGSITGTGVFSGLGFRGLNESEGIFFTVDNKIKFNAGGYDIGAFNQNDTVYHFGIATDTLFRVNTAETKVFNDLTVDGNTTLEDSVSLNGEKIGQWSDIDSLISKNDCFIIALSDSLTELTTANGDSWVWPYNCSIDSVVIAVNSAPAGSILDVDIKKNTTSIFSTRITIDADEKTSVTAATDYTLSSTTISFLDDMQAYSQSVGSTFGGAGLKIYIYYKKD